MIELPAGTVHEIMRARRAVLDREEEAIRKASPAYSFTDLEGAAMHALGVAGALLDACADDLHLLAAQGFEANVYRVLYQNALRGTLEGFGVAPSDVTAAIASVEESARKLLAERLTAERGDAPDPTAEAVETL